MTQTNFFGDVEMSEVKFLVELPNMGKLGPINESEVSPILMERFGVSEWTAGVDDFNRPLAIVPAFAESRRLTTEKLLRSARWENMGG